MELIVISLLFAVLLSLPVLLREKHLRRLAEARLETARVVTEMEKMMLAGQIKDGEACHGKLYRWMLASMYAKDYSATWQLWRGPSPQFVEFRKQLHKEICGREEVQRLFVRHIFATFKAFRNARPVVSICFVFWVLLFAGGLGMLFVGVWGVRRATKAWQNFKQLAAESYVSLARTA